MPLSYYIYYRVAQPAQALALVGRIRAALKAGTGIDGRLLRKRGDASMWMEIYEGVDDAGKFDQCLAEALQTMDFTGVLEPGGMRHMECFEDSCA